MTEKEDSMDTIKGVIKAMEDAGESKEYVLAVTCSLLGMLNYKVWRDAQEARGIKVP